MAALLDYDLCKLFFDLQTDRSLAEQYRRDRLPVLARYELSHEVLRAVLSDDVLALARFTNPFLLRYYFFMIGMPEDTFIARLQPLRDERVAPERAGG